MKNDSENANIILGWRKQHIICFCCLWVVVVDDEILEAGQNSVDTY